MPKLGSSCFNYSVRLMLMYVAMNNEHNKATGCFADSTGEGLGSTFYGLDTLLSLLELRSIPTYSGTIRVE